MSRVVCFLLYVWTCQVLANSWLRRSEEDVDTLSQGKCLELREDPASKLLSAYMPLCTEDGKFAPRQCHFKGYRENYCWCSKPNGEEIPGSRVLMKKPDCGDESDVIRSANCRRLIEIIGLLKNYIEQVTSHIVNETNIFEDRLDAKVLNWMKSSPPFEVGLESFVHIGDGEAFVMFITEQGCRVADAKDFLELFGQTDLPEPPNRIKEFFGYLLLQLRVIRGRVFELTDTLVKSGYPNFPLKVNKCAVNVSFERLLDALRDFGAWERQFFPEKDNILPFVVKYMESVQSILNRVLEANNIEEALSGENMMPVEVELLFDVLNNRDLYWRSVDIFLNAVIGVTDIGLLDLQ